MFGAGKLLEDEEEVILDAFKPALLAFLVNVVLIFLLLDRLIGDSVH